MTNHTTAFLSHTVPNILADRYASDAIKQIWSTEGRILIEREFWIAVLQVQREFGVNIPEKAINAYEAVKTQINPQSIREREKVTRHDIKARIDEFCALAGYEDIHKGLTSRDLSENIEQLQIFRSLQIIREKAVTALLYFGQNAKTYQYLLITGRTHNVAAQMTTYGKRLAMHGEEFLEAIQRLDSCVNQYIARGIKGAVGTQLDLLTLFENDISKVDLLEKKLATYLGLPRTLQAVGQVYPRSLDFEVVSILCQLAAGPANFAKTLRLMAGHGLASEGFSSQQVGSSAMPHKMNSRSCERLNGFAVVLKGYLMMAAELIGDQWNEGDVSCSVVRRVFLPDTFFAIDGLLETLLNILQQMQPFPEMISLENEHHLPFLLTTTILMESVRAGSGREAAHEVIRKHAITTTQDLRSRKIEKNDLLQRLAEDPEIPLNASDLKCIEKNIQTLCGNACQQVDHFLRSVKMWEDRFPRAANLQPSSLL